MHLAPMNASKMLRSLLYLLFPELCLGCRTVLLGREQLLCLACRVALERTDAPHSEAMLRLAGRFPFVQAFALAPFSRGGLLQSVLHQLKYQGRQDAGRYLGRMLGEAMLRHGVVDGIDRIVPVPLHRKKERTRGYNQAAVISEGMSEALGVPVDTTLLRRVRDTGSQTSRGRRGRLGNMEEAFACCGTIPAGHLLLVDDVLTTGATIEACALPLLRHSGVRVSVATVGIAAE